MKHLWAISALFLMGAASWSQSSRIEIQTKEYEIVAENVKAPITHLTQRQNIPLSERGIPGQRVENDPGYSEKYEESVLVVDETVNTTLEPMFQSGAIVTFKVKSTDGGAHQSGDFSKELNAQFKYLSDPIPTRDIRRRDWEGVKSGGSGSTTGTLGPVTGTVEPGFAQVTFLRYWTLTQREERSVGNGKRKKTGWRETVTRGTVGGSIGYWPHRQRFVP